MRDWWMRYKERKLTEKDHEKVGLFVLLPYLLGSLLGAGLTDGEMGAPSDVIMYLALAIFVLPWLAIVLLIQAHTPPLLPSLRRRIALFIVAVVCAAFASGGGFGYIDVANALTGSPTPVTVSGPVIAMKRYSAGWAGPRRVITIRFADRDVVLSVNLDEYDRIKVGDIYSRQMMLGGLGYYYQWGWGFWK